MDCLAPCLFCKIATLALLLEFILSLHELPRRAFTAFALVLDLNRDFGSTANEFEFPRVRRAGVLATVAQP
jgi:hypothetical protein